VSDEPPLVAKRLAEGPDEELLQRVEALREAVRQTMKWRRRRQWTLAILAGILLVATFIAGVVASQSDDDRSPDAPTALPTGVAVYDIAGDDAPEFVKIDGEILPVTAPAEDAWWVPFLPFLGIVFAALVTAGASVWSDRRRAELEDRISGIESTLKASTTAQPAQDTNAADRQTHGP
jgi:hypothetical protein